MQINVDQEIADCFETLWREEISKANQKNEKIPSFSEFMNDKLKRLRLMIVQGK
jgi:hypothetical protein